MRIELPATSWATTHRAQDDAHTLTLPPQREPNALLAAFAPVVELPSPAQVSALPAARAGSLTLTF
jgi:hypothetical protein